MDSMDASSALRNISPQNNCLPRQNFRMEICEPPSSTSSTPSMAGAVCLRMTNSMMRSSPKSSPMSSLLWNVPWQKKNPCELTSANLRMLMWKAIKNISPIMASHATASFGTAYIMWSTTARNIAVKRLPFSPTSTPLPETWTLRSF